MATVRFAVQRECLVGDTEQNGRFGTVRGQHICQLGEFAHRRTHFFCVSAVRLAVVAHDRVNHDVVACGLESANKIGGEGHLFLTAHKAGVYRIKGDTFGVPVGGDIGHLIGEVEKSVARKTTCVGGEVGGRQRTALYAHRREGWHDDTERAASETAEVVDSGNARCVHSSTLLCLVRIAIIEDFFL